MKARSHIYQLVAPQKTGGHSPQASSKSNYSFVLPSYESFHSIFDYQVGKINSVKANDQAFFNQLNACQNITNACKQALKRSAKPHVQNCKKLQTVQAQLSHERIQHNALKIRIETKDRQISALKQSIQQFQAKIIKIKEDHKNQLASKDDQLKTLEISRKTEKEEMMKNLKQTVSKIVGAMNFSQENQKPSFNDFSNEDQKNLIDCAIQKISEKMKILTILQERESLITEYLQKSGRILSEQFILSCGPNEYRQGKSVNIFQGVQQEMSNKIRNLNLNRKQKTNYLSCIELNTLLDMMQKDMNKIQEAWGNKLAGQISKYNDLLNTKQKEIERLNIEMAGIKKELNEEKIKNERLSKEVQSLKERIAQLERELADERQRNARKIRDLQDEISRLKAVLVIQKQNVRRGQEQRERLMTQITELNLKIKQKDEDIVKNKVDINNKNIEIGQKNQHIREKDQQLKRLYQAITALQQKVAQLQGEITQMNRQNQSSNLSINQKDQLIKKLQLQCKRLQAVIKGLEKDLQDKKRQIRQLKIQLDLKSKSLSQTQVTLDKEQYTSTQRKSKIQQLQNQIKKQLKPMLQQAQQKRKNAENLYQKILDNPPRQYLQYFNGNILNYQNRDYLKWFVIKLQDSVKRKIRSTKPLYRFDPRNREPFHTYIDSYPHIVLIVKAQNKQIIAGYSKCAFVPKTNVEFQQGYMFGLLNKKVFRVKKESTNKHNRTNPKPITYDDCYLIWGNADIRIKSGTNELYSNYATSSGSYEEVGNENATIEDLFMYQERDNILIDYELFAIDFDDY